MLQMEKTNRKILFIILMTIVVSLAALLACSEEAHAMSGNGTEGDPYQIENTNDWNEFADEVSEGRSKDKYYRLRYSIEASTTVGTEANPFEGHFDGHNYTLTASISDTTNNGTAVFRYTNNAVIQNMTVDGTIRGGKDNDTNTYMGGLVGFANGTTTISRIDVKAAVIGGEHVGGIVGNGLHSNLTIKDCTFSGSLSGRSNMSGLLGWSEGQDLTIKDCLFTGSYEHKNSSSPKTLVFHPIALMSPVAQMTVDIDGAYYASTVPPAGDSVGKHTVTSGTTVYVKNDVDLSAGKFYKTVRIRDNYMSYYYPVKTVSLELAKPFFQYGTDTYVSYTVKVDGELLSRATDYEGLIIKSGLPPNQDTGPLLQRGVYTLTVNGKNGYLGKLETRFVYTDIGERGTENDPYMIDNVDEWNQFRDILTTGAGYDFENKFVKLGSNITITTMAGTEQHPFSGTFDGQNKTLTCNINADTEGAAPFNYIKGATIKNITVAGTIKSNAYYSAGVVGFALGDDRGVWNTVDKATVTANITASDYCSGVVGHSRRSTIVIKNTVFSGKLTCDMWNRRYSGAGFLARNDGGVLRMTNCINKGSKGSEYYWWNPVVLPGSSNDFTTDVRTTYYKENVASGDDMINTPNLGGILAHTSAISGKMSTKVVAADNVTYYIDENIKIDGIRELYKYTGQNLTIPYKVLAQGEEPKELVKDTDFTEKFNKTVKDKGEYTLTVSGKGNYTGSTSIKFRVEDQLEGSGTKGDPYQIRNNNDWTIFKNAIEKGHTYKNEFIELTANISIGNVMAGTETYPFEGTFDGNGKTLTAAISGSTKGAAPFYVVRGATIRNLTVAGTITGGDWTSGLAGLIKDSPVNISNVEVKATVKSGKYLGGFIGHSYKVEYNRIYNSIFSGELNCTGSTGYIGGFAGWSDRPGYSMYGCLFKGKVTGKVTLFHPAGIYSYYNSGYYGEHGGTVYYTRSGAQIGEDDNVACILQEWNVQPKRVYTADELKADELYRDLLINGEQVGCYLQSEKSRVIVNELYVTKERTPVVITPEVQFNDDKLDSSLFTFEYSKFNADLGDFVPVSEDDLDKTGDYSVKATAKGGGDFVGSVSTEFRIIAFSGEGTEDDPVYLGYNEVDHNEWEDFVDAIAAGYTFKGQYIRIANIDNITVTRPAGTEEHPFEGIFDGANSYGMSNTFNIDLNDTENQGTAMFRYIADGAEIWNLNVAGNVKGGRHSAGLVGFALRGKVGIHNVNVSVNVSDGDYVGGIVGHGKKSDLTIMDARYTGRINGGSSFAGGLLGWSDGQKLTIERCIFEGQYFGTGSFHPVAVKNRGESMNNSLRHVYYINTQGPSISNDNIAASGTPVYTKAMSPQNVLSSKVYGNYYAEARVSNVAEEYELELNGITPQATVLEEDGTKLTSGTDYTVQYLNTNTLETVDRITKEGNYKLILNGNNSKTVGRQEVGPFNVTANGVRSVTLNKTSAQLNFDRNEDSVQLEATVLPATAINKKVIWESSDPSVATVDKDGFVKAAGEGTAVITVTADDTTYGIKSASCTVTVVKTQADFSDFPTAKLLTYNGSPQALLNQGASAKGTVRYKLENEEEYRDEIPAGTDAGLYTVKYKIFGDDKHADSEEVLIQAEIGKAYGGADITNSAAVITGGTLDLDTLVDAGGDFVSPRFVVKDGDTTESSITDQHIFNAGYAGRCTVEVTIPARKNYYELKEDIVITIDDKQFSEITVSMSDWTYGETPDGSDPSYTIPAEEMHEGAGVMVLYNGKTRGGDEYIELDTKPEEAGIYHVNIFYEGVTRYFYGSADFVVMPKNIDADSTVITLPEEKLVYTGEELEQQVSKVESDGVDITASCVVESNKAVNAGKYNLVVMADETSNYTGSRSCEFEVEKAVPTFTPPTPREGLVYNGTNQVLINPGTAEGGVMKYNNNGQGSFPDPDEDGNEILPVGDVGTYLVKYTVKGDANHKDIYGSQYAFPVTIAPAECTFKTEPEAITGLIYTGEEQALVTAGLSQDGHVMYRIGDEGEFAAKLPKAKDAGEYEVYYKAVAKEDEDPIYPCHVDSPEYGPVLVSIGKKDSEIIEAPKAIEDLKYDGKEHALVEAGEVNGGVMLYGLEEDGEFTEMIPAAAEAGNYKVYYKVDGQDNYSGTDVEGPVEVNIAKGEFPGRILRYGISAGYGEEIDLSEFAECEYELEYSIDPDATDAEGCSINEGVLTTGSSDGRCYVAIKVKDTERYEAAYIFVNVSNVRFEDITVHQDDITYGKGVVAPEFDDYRGDTSADDVTYTYYGMLANGQRYGGKAEEYETAPKEAGTYNVNVYYMIGNHAYSGEADFMIKPAEIKDAKVTLGSKVKYNGSEQTQEIASIVYAGEDITELCDISDNKATETGNYELTVTPKKDAYNFTGTAKVKFTVYPDDATLEAAKKAAIEELNKKYKLSDYTGKAKAAVKKALADAKKAISKAETLEEIEAAKKAAAKAISANKKKNTLKAKGKTIKARYSKLKKKTLKFKKAKAVKVTGSKGKLTFKRLKVTAKKKLLKQAKKKIRIAKNGRITLKKGLKKGTYKIRIRVKAAGNKYYKAGTKTVTVRIKVK